MSELRRNPITGEWVTFAVNRGNRPYDFVKTNTPKEDTKKTCPFCIGNESETTKAVFQDKENDWTVRVFPNKYPAFSGEEVDSFSDEIYESITGVGIHEVIVDTPDHFEKLHQFTKEHMLDVFKALKNRYDDTYKNDFVKYVQIFKNNGAEAGMSIVHSHWQIIGMPIFGRIQKDTLYYAKKHKKEHNSCIMCDIINKEKEINVRLIEENDSFVVFVPYAPKMSFETWIVPKKHIYSFGQFDEKHMKDFSDIFHNTIKRVSMINEDISYNICFMDSPKGDEQKYFHWYARIVPRIGNFAGLEFSTGVFINPLMPEESAKIYKSKRL